MIYGNKITKILNTDLDGFKVKLRFSNGTLGTVSLRNVFSSPKNLSAEILRGGMFDKCFIESGALAWPNGFELCADAVYQWYLEQKDARAS